MRITASSLRVCSRRLSRCHVVDALESLVEIACVTVSDERCDFLDTHVASADQDHRFLHSLREYYPNLLQ